MITTMLFDMDGVLVDSQPMHYDADIQTMAHYGFVITQEELEKFAGTNLAFQYSRLKDAYHITQDLDEIMDFREKMIMEHVYRWPLHAPEGVRELLVDLQNAGMKLTVASSSSDELIEATLKRLNFSSFFSKIVSGMKLEHGKPAPDVFLLAAEASGSLPEECAVIEDSHNGVLAAVAAGMKVVGYQNPTSGEQDLSDADLVIDDFRKIDAGTILALGGL